MFKKLGLTAILSTAIMFGGVMTASAETVSDQSSKLSYKAHAFYLVDGEWQQLSGNKISEFLATCFPGHSIDWGKEDNKPSMQDEPKQEESTNESSDEQSEKQQEEAADPVEEQPTEQPEEPEEQEAQPTEQPEEQPAEQMDNQDADQIETPAPQEEAADEQAENNQTEADGQLSQYEQEVVDLTNKEREQHGLSPLQVDTELSKVAREKSNDMATNGYFSHNSPVYGSPFDMMKDYGIDYMTAGENIAKGQQTPEEVVNAWMNSDGHRANILNGEFTHIGVGFVEQGNHWTQQFIGK